MMGDVPMAAAARAQAPAGAGLPAHIKADLPAIAYFVGGLAALTGWLAGTSVQIWTSEMWMLSATGVNVNGSTLRPHFEVLLQFIAFWGGGLTQEQIVPYCFGYACQLALIAFSIGMELPKTSPAAKKRSTFFAWACLGLVVINSIGDAFYARNYGFLGAVGFALGMIFMTFCCGLLAVIAFQHGAAAWKRASAAAN